MNNKIIINLSRCVKAGFLYATKPHLIPVQDKLNEYFEEEVKKEILAIIQNYYEEDKEVVIQVKEKFENTYGASAIADCLIISPEKTILIGISSRVNVKDHTQKWNLAYTYRIIKSTGKRIDEVVRIIPKSNCIEPGKLTMQDLIFYDYTDKVQRFQSRLEKGLARFKEIVRNNSTPPDKIGYQCITVGVCPLLDYCKKKEFPEKNNIGQLQGIRFSQLLNMKWKGFIDFTKEKPKNIILPKKAEDQIEATKNHRTIIRRNKIKKWINDVTEKNFIWFWDFETTKKYAPLENCIETFSDLPWMYSLYYYDLSSKDKGVLQQLLNEPISTENIKVFTKNMITDFSLRPNMPIIVSNIERAKVILNTLISICPEYKNQLEDITSSLYDIRAIFEDQLYYNPKFYGSLYMKDIVPIMCPDVSYKNLAFKSGVEAHLGWISYSQETVSDRRNQLIEYSKMDAWALLRTFEFLKSITR
jgi:Domain of unknown function(DUF2779)